MPTANYAAILQALVKHKVDFVLVGDVGAVLQGAPILTFDLDIVHSIEVGNIERVTAALDSLEAMYGMQPERKIRPQVSHLISPGHQLLLTRCGPLDVRGAISAGHTYEDLIQKAIAIKIADGVSVPVLELAALVAIKEETAGEKDQAVLPVLRQTLRERS